MKKLIKWILGIVSVFLSIVLVVGIFYGTKGYSLYREATKANPLPQLVEGIQSKQHYTLYEELPEFYIHAVVAVEDHRFQHHHGIDPIAICRAVWNDVKTLSFAEGGSTITQQLAKNLYFTQEKKLDRKFAEIFVAFDLERDYSKKEILELYVNTIYFGNGCYGVYEAAQEYFGKPPKELTDYESAMLAGIPNAPSAYSPSENPELAEQRLRQVLKRMETCGVVTNTEIANILEESLT